MPRHDCRDHLGFTDDPTPQCCQQPRNMHMLPGAPIEVPQPSVLRARCRQEFLQPLQRVIAAYETLFAQVAFLSRLACLSQISN